MAPRPLIWVIEPDADMRDALCSLIAEERFEVACLDNISAAPARVADGSSPAAVIVACGRADLTEIAQFVQRLRADPPTSRALTVVLSTIPLVPMDRLTQVLIKPFKGSELLALLSAVTC